MTQSGEMTRGLTLAAMVMAVAPAFLGAQTAQDEPLIVSTEHPRLFLRPARLRLLKRERERSSMRWRQFEALLVGNAPMPEPGFAYALYYAVSGDARAGKSAIEWALGPNATDLRQLALVYDWCLPAMTGQQAHTVTARILKQMADTAADQSVSAIRSRALASIALFDDVPDAPQKELDRIGRAWWTAKIVPALASGRNVFARDDAYPLLELFHAVRDTTNADLREGASEFFRDFPIEHLMSYYPPAWPGAENEYYIGAEPKPAEPDLRQASLSRAAELAMVALDANALEIQELQGWLMHDNFMLRGTLGAPYEFLWANPYQPGLSYYHIPLVFYNAGFGRLYVRSSWDDTARWFGYFDGVVQMFADGHATVVDPRAVKAPVSFGAATICFAAGARKFEMTLEDEDAVFIVGLEPGRTYRVEVDDEEMFEAPAGRGGILQLDDVPHGKAIAIRIADSLQLTVDSKH